MPVARPLGVSCQRIAAPVECAGRMNSVVSVRRPAVFLDPADVKRILYLAIPAQLALLTQTGVNLVDTYFIGLLGEPERSDGQAMLSFALALLWAIGGFLSAISVGTQAMVARREGRKDPQASGLVLANALVLAVCSSVVASVAFWVVVPHI